MGDGYCYICTQEGDRLLLSGGFITKVFSLMRRDELERLKPSLQDAMMSGCDECGGQNGDQLMEWLAAEVEWRDHKKNHGKKRRS
jgi:hypothetical protein